MSEPPVQLPYELWFHIATFLTIEEMKCAKLYTLNRPFLNLYLHERYKALYLKFEYECPNPTHVDSTIFAQKLRHIQ